MQGAAGKPSQQGRPWHALDYTVMEEGVTCEDANRQEHHQDDEGQGCHFSHFLGLPTPPERHPVDLCSTFWVVIAVPVMHSSEPSFPMKLHHGIPDTPLITKSARLLICRAAPWSLWH